MSILRNTHVAMSNSRVEGRMLFRGIRPVLRNGGESGNWTSCSHNDAANVGRKEKRKSSAAGVPRRVGAGRGPRGRWGVGGGGGGGGSFRGPYQYVMVRDHRSAARARVHR